MLSHIKPRFPVAPAVGEGLARDLVGAWLFNEGGGRVANDASVRRAAAQATGWPGWKAGPGGWRLDLDGSVYLDAGPMPFLHRFTLCACVKFEGATWDTRYTIVSRGDHATAATNFSFYLHRTSPNVRRLHIQANSTSGYYAYHQETAVWGPFDGDWHVLGASWDGSQFALYLDGAPLSRTSAVHGAGTDGGQSFRIARGSNDQTLKWVGGIDFVYVWGRALSAQEMRRVSAEPYAPVREQYPLGLLGLAQATFRHVSGTASAGAAAAATATVSHAEERPTGAPWPAVALDTPNPWQREALLNGLTETGYRLGTVLTQGWFWVRRAGCTAVYRSPDANPAHAEFGSPVAVVDITDSEIRVSHVDPGPDATWCYVARRFSGSGQQDRTTAAAALLRTGADGRLAPATPNPVVRLHAEGVEGNKIELVWFYWPLDQQAPPRTFHVYGDHGTGQIDLVNPLATVPYRGRRYYSYRTGSLEAGRYRFAVRAEAAPGIEGPPQSIDSPDVGGPMLEVPAVVAVEIA